MSIATKSHYRTHGLISVFLYVVWHISNRILNTADAAMGGLVVWYDGTNAVGREWGDLSLYCQTRTLFGRETYVEAVSALPNEIWWHKWDPTTNNVTTAILLSCTLSEPLTGSAVVSVVKNPCEDAANSFEVTPCGSTDYARNFTICVKDMNFDDDYADRLIEWIEFHRILGGEMFDLYVENVTQNLMEVLDYYQKEGTVRIFKAPVRPSSNVLWQRRRDHLISYNDCLYRNLAESRFVIPLDLDEVVVPKRSDNWSTLLERLSSQGWDPQKYPALAIKNVFFYDFLNNNISNYNKPNDIIHTNVTYEKRDDVRITDIKNATLDSKLVNTSSFEDSNKTVYISKPYLKSIRNIMRSSHVSPIKFYCKSFMLTKLVLTVFNHYPLHTFTKLRFWPTPFAEAQLNHYRVSCDPMLVPDCQMYSQQSKPDRTALRFANILEESVARVKSNIMK